MVVVGDMEIKIVWADTKTPFLEHQKNGATYIEVEPDAEYFISLRRVSMNLPRPIVCHAAVDGQNLGWKISFGGISGNERLIGIREPRVVQQESSSHRCLRFVKPKIEDNEEGKTMGYSPSSYVSLIGKITVKVYEAKRTRTTPKKSIRNKPHPNLNATLATEHSMAPQQKIASKLKYVRSSTGAEIMPNVSSGRQFKRVQLIDEITLNYATMPGLIKAGLFAPVAQGVGSNSACAGIESTSSARNGTDVSPDRQQTLSNKRAASALVTPPASQESQDSNKRQKKSDAVRQLNFYDLT